MSIITLACAAVLTEKQIDKRLEWAENKKNWTFDQWKNVIWSDESRYRVVRNDEDARVIRLTGKRYNSKNVVGVQKFGKGSVMIWSCFIAGKLGPLVFMDDGNVNQTTYVSCLSNEFLPWLFKLKQNYPENDYIFQEDNATSHTGSYTTWYKNRAQVNMMDFWPPQSPDLNLIEHLWAVLERLIEDKRHLIKNKEDLKYHLKK